MVGDIMNKVYVEVLNFAGKKLTFSDWLATLEFNL